MTVADSNGSVYNRNADQFPLAGTCNFGTAREPRDEGNECTPQIARCRAIGKRRANVTQDIHQIQRLVADASGLTVLDLCSARRDRRLARTRQLAMWLCRRLTPHSLPAIGREFGDRDHSTVMHALAVIDRLMAADVDFARRVIWFAQFVDSEQHIAGRAAA